MRALVIVLGFFAVVAAFRAGEHVRAYAQSRADLRDARTKARKARTARRSAMTAAVTGWALLAGALLLAGVALISGR